MEARSKYNVAADNAKRTYDGIVFDSEAEMNFYKDYCIPKIKNGEINTCKMQVKYVLQDGFIRNGKKILPIDYKADFVLEYANNTIQVIDIKGCPDTTALLKRKMFWYRYPEIDYLWLSYSKIDGGWIEYDTLKKNRKIRKKLKLEQQGNKEKKEKQKNEKRKNSDSQ